ncbi:hypothetical protein [Polaromonas sp.]|uniref:sensor histidine kinase n=1 Tax=Polaromonas sp. TaxID=1869339 RepID=UPI003265FF21
MTDLYDAAVALVVAGSSVGLTLFWLRHLSRQHRGRMDQLLALRESLHDDLLGTLVLHQKTLADLGLRSLDWRGNWYGSPVFTRLGAKIPLRPHEGGARLSFDAERISDRILHQRFDYDDISLEFRIGLKGLRGERHLFAVQASEVLFAMIQGALAARQLALVAASSQRARVGVFLQHDMRNLAQWVQLVAEDFGSAESDAELLTRAKRLKKNAAHATQRAERMSQALLNPAWQASVSAPLEMHGAAELELLDLPEHIRQAAELHQVEIDLAGSARVEWDSHALAAVLDNVLGNVSSLSRERMLPASCRIVIKQDAQNTLVSMETKHLRLEIPLEKLFEPWSSSGSVNKGLGMYQARKQAQAAGGELFAETLGTGLRVMLSIPL